MRAAARFRQGRCMHEPPGTYLVECFWPGVTEAAHRDAVERAGAAARTLTAGGHDVRFLGAQLVPADEIAFYRFAAASADAVERASVMAGLPFERILECVES